METELLIEAKAYVDRLTNGVDQLANELEKMDITNISSLSDCLEGCLWINKLLLSEGKKEKNDDYIEFVEDVSNLLENEDWHSIGDALLYGLKPILIEWSSVLDKLNN